MLNYFASFTPTTISKIQNYSTLTAAIFLFTKKQGRNATNSKVHGYKNVNKQKIV